MTGNPLRRARHPRPLDQLLFLIALSGALLHCSRAPLPLPDQAVASTSEWPAYGGDLGGQRHAKLDTLTPESVEFELALLEIQWCVEKLRHVQLRIYEPPLTEVGEVFVGLLC